MADFRPFDYGNVLATGERIKSERQRRNFLANQEQRAQTQFDQQQQAYSDSQKLNNTKMLYHALAEIEQNPASYPMHMDRLKKNGIIQPEFDVGPISDQELSLMAGEQKAKIGQVLRDVESIGQKPINQLGAYQPGNYTPESWVAATQGTNRMVDPSLLVRYESPVQANLGGVPHLVYRSGGSGRTQPLSTLQAEAGAEQTVAGAREQGKQDVQQEMEPRTAELTEDAKKRAQERAKFIEETNKNIGFIKRQNNNLRKVIAEVKAGANSGPLMKLMPTLTDASLRLQQINRDMGLEIVGATTFGALSKGELDLSLETAIPPLPGPELAEWAEAKIAANEKLAREQLKLARYLRQGGNIEDWMAENVSFGQPTEPGTEAPQGGAPPGGQPGAVRWDDL